MCYPPADKIDLVFPQSLAIFTQTNNKRYEGAAFFPYRCCSARLSKALLRIRYLLLCKGLSGVLYNVFHNRTPIWGQSVGALYYGRSHSRASGCAGQRASRGFCAILHLVVLKGIQ